MKLNDGNLFRPSLLAAMVGLSVASAAIAQGEKKESDEPKVRGEFGRPLNAGGDDDQVAGSSTMTISRSSDGQTYSVTIKDGKVSAEINGKPVPEERIERRRDAIILKDENGKEVTRFDVGRNGRGARVLRLDNNGLSRLNPFFRDGQIELGPDMEVQAQPTNPPPVMLGVTMSDATDEQLEHQDYKHGVVVDRVLEDLPAARSGVEVGDIIVEINGQKSVDQETIRSTLRGLKPGDEVALKVIRKGKAQDIKVKLDAYDAEKLGHVWNQGDPQQWWSQGQGDEITDQLRQSLKMLGDLKGVSPEQSKQMRDAMNEAIKRLESGGRMWRLAPRGNLGMPLDPNAPIVIGRNQDQVFEIPGSSDLSRKIDKLTDTIDQLNERIERLEKQLKEKNR